jgi:RNA polymerase sigma-70 factor (ECF subfamily)
VCEINHAAAARERIASERRGRDEPASPAPPVAAPAHEGDQVARLRRGDEAAFRELIDTLSPALLRAAMAYVPSRAVAEEVVQETWMAVMRGIDGFEGRSSLKTWIFRILTNLAMKGGGRERRSVPFSSLAGADDPGGPSVDPDRFLAPEHERFPGHWRLAPTRWPSPEEGLLAGETRGVVVRAIASLPQAQRVVITLRDIGGWESDEVCQALDISAGNQRVLLHRARTAVRAAIEAHLGAVEDVVAADEERAVTRPPPGDTAPRMESAHEP